MVDPLDQRHISVNKQFLNNARKNLYSYLVDASNVSPRYVIWTSKQVRKLDDYFERYGSSDWRLSIGLSEELLKDGLEQGGWFLGVPIAIEDEADAPSTIV